MPKKPKHDRPKHPDPAKQAAKEARELENASKRLSYVGHRPTKPPKKDTLNANP